MKLSGVRPRDWIAKDANSKAHFVKVAWPGMVMETYCGKIFSVWRFPLLKQEVCEHCLRKWKGGAS